MRDLIRLGRNTRVTYPHRIKIEPLQVRADGLKFRVRRETELQKRIERMNKGESNLLLLQIAFEILFDALLTMETHAVSDWFFSAF